ncbi:MAG: hypothetical protein FWB80_13850 [Defluviitaleaceae bacterium]|nr:hypothetical protein [Defluviitaleaceae bacterium]
MVKNEVVKMVSGMDDEVSMGDIMYQLYIMEKHDRAMKDIEDGNVHTTQNVRESLRNA